MKNDFIAIILPYSLLSCESSFELNDELTIEFEWNGWDVPGITNDLILGVAIAGSDVWVGMTRFVDELMTSWSTWGVIQTSCMVELGEWDGIAIKGL